MPAAASSALLAGLELLPACSPNHHISPLHHNILVTITGLAQSGPPELFLKEPIYLLLQQSSLPNICSAPLLSRLLPAPRFPDTVLPPLSPSLTEKTEPSKSKQTKWVIFLSDSHLCNVQSSRLPLTAGPQASSFSGVSERYNI